MSTAFFEKSKEITNEFLQSIVFLDDKAFENNSKIGSKQSVSQHAFDSFEISKAFAIEKKICAVYKPQTVNDIENFTLIAKKADVVILDWFIEIGNTEVEEDKNTDADAEDPRGQYTKQIINELINGSGDCGLKLIVIYTGDNILVEITEDIHNYISLINLEFKSNLSNCEVYSNNIRILVRAKSIGEEGDTRFKHRPDLKDKILCYKDLPSFVLNELTVMTSGLLSNFALLSLATIRNNSHKILSLFAKELDASYLGHKVMLPIQEDSEDLLLKLFGDTISDLLHYASIPQKIQTEWIDIWIDSHIKDESVIIGGRTIQRTSENIKKLLKNHKGDISERFESVFYGGDLSKNVVSKLYKESKTTELFLNVDKQGDKDLINRRFASLTHHKSLFLPKDTAPKLTLGTIIRDVKHNGSYYVCIQQRCDSVRIEKDEERKFLFLPLTEDGNAFHIVTPDGTKLKLDKKSYSIKTIKFKCNDDSGEIKGEELMAGKVEGEERKEIKIKEEQIEKSVKYAFKTIYGDEYEWVLDLKDLHSQRIVTNYVSSLSRIGLDESEWLRIAGN